MIDLLIIELYLNMPLVDELELVIVLFILAHPGLKFLILYLVFVSVVERIRIELGQN